MESPRLIVSIWCFYTLLMHFTVYPTIETVEFKELDEGSTIDLFVKFNGNPLPKLEWKFGDKTITSTERWNI